MRRSGVMLSVAALLTACSHSASRPSFPTTVAPSITTTTASPITLPTRPTGFQPAGASFINAHDGWVLGAIGCESCLQVRSTVDAGGTWKVVSSPSEPFFWSANAPPSAVSDIYFADRENGFLYNPGLQISHNGGRTWASGSLTGVAQIVSANGKVYATSGSPNHPPSVWKATIGSNTWTPVSLPPSAISGFPPDTETGYVLATEANVLLLMQAGISGPGLTPTSVGGLWSSTDGGNRWEPHLIPCTVSDGGAAALTIALGHPQAWLLDCYDNLQSSQEQFTRHHLYGTTNGGRAWVRLGDPSTTGAPAELADNGAGHAFLATVGGVDLFHGTFNGGRSWSTLFPSGGNSFDWADLQFVTSAEGFVVGPTHYAPTHLYRTEDGGRTWVGLHFSG